MAFDLTAVRTRPTRVTEYSLRCVLSVAVPLHITEAGRQSDVCSTVACGNCILCRNTYYICSYPSPRHCGADRILSLAHCRACLHADMQLRLDKAVCPSGKVDLIPPKIRLISSLPHDRGFTLHVNSLFGKIPWPLTFRREHAVDWLTNHTPRYL